MRRNAEDPVISKISGSCLAAEGRPVDPDDLADLESRVLFAP
jgi:hypothetical protein